MLFSINTDSLLSALRDSGAGCYLGHVFAGALAYADDIVLLAPTKGGLSRMLAVASTCADDLSLKFNGTKSQYLTYCARRRTHEGTTFLFVVSRFPCRLRVCTLEISWGPNPEVIPYAVLSKTCT